MYVGRKVNVARHASGHNLGDNIRKRDAEVKDFEVNWCASWDSLLSPDSGLEIPTLVGHTCPSTVIREGQAGIPVCLQSLSPFRRLGTTKINFKTHYFLIDIHYSC